MSVRERERERVSERLTRTKAILYINVIVTYHKKDVKLKKKYICEMTAFNVDIYNNLV